MAACVSAVHTCYAHCPDNSMRRLGELPGHLPRWGNPRPAAPAAASGHTPTQRNGCLDGSFLVRSLPQLAAPDARPRSRDHGGRGVAASGGVTRASRGGKCWGSNPQLSFFRPPCRDGIPVVPCRPAGFGLLLRGVGDGVSSTPGHASLANPADSSGSLLALFL